MKFKREALVEPLLNLFYLRLMKCTMKFVKNETVVLIITMQTKQCKLEKIKLPIFSLKLRDVSEPRETLSALKK